jgi:hypothetical protein
MELRNWRRMIVDESSAIKPGNTSTGSPCPLFAMNLRIGNCNRS